MDRSLTPTNKGVAGIPWRDIPSISFPMPWFSNITFEDGKPHIQAMLILADVVAWYKPRAIEDPESGLVIRYERKFKGEKLQAYSGYFEEKFRLSEKQCRVAKDRLVDVGVIIFEIVDKYPIIGGDGSVTYKYNVPFIDLNLPVLYKITMPNEWKIEGGGMSYRAQGCVLQGTGVCPTGHTTDITYTEYSPSLLQREQTISSGGDDPYIGKTYADIFPRRNAQNAAEKNKLLVESIGLPWDQWHKNVAKLAAIHGLTVAIEKMGSDKDLQAMQDLTNQLAAIHIDTEEKIDALHKNWLNFSSLGKKAKKDKTPPMGSNLRQHASFLGERGMLNEQGFITAPVGGSTNGGTGCGDSSSNNDIDYTGMAAEGQADLLPEVSFGDSGESGEQLSLL